MKTNNHGFVHTKGHRLSNGKPVIRIKSVSGIRYRYTHVKGDLNPLVVSDKMVFGGYLVKLSIGLELFEKFA